MGITGHQARTLKMGVACHIVNMWGTPIFQPCSCIQTSKSGRDECCSEKKYLVEGDYCMGRSTQFCQLDTLPLALLAVVPFGFAHDE